MISIQTRRELKRHKRSLRSKAKAKMARRYGRDSVRGKNRREGGGMWTFPKGWKF